MERKLHNILPFMGLMASFVFGSVHADQDDSYGQSTDSQDTTSSQYTTITPPAGPRVNDGVDMFISADYILWAPRMDGLQYALTNFTTATQQNLGRGSEYSPVSGYESGFKVGLGFASCHDSFDFGVQYTWLRYNNKNSVTSNNIYPTLDVASLQDGGAIVGEVTAANSRWKFSFNVIDVTMARNYFVSKYLKLRPFGGFKGTWQTHHFNTTYSAVNDFTDTTEELKLKQKMSYWGFGLAGGLNTAWHFTESFSLYGDVGTSLLWAGYQVSRTDTVDNLPGDPSNTLFTVISTSNNFHTVKPVFEFGLGLRYDLWFSDDAYHFLAQLGWEEQLWVNFNQFSQLGESSLGGDLSLQGLTFKLRFDF